MTNIIKTFTVIPDLEGLQQTFINDGHSIDERIAELIDNSKDANATKINMLLDCTFFWYADNGYGIQNIHEALTIGKKNLGNFIGKYGIGLKSALFGIGSNIIVYTKQPKQELKKYRWNVNKQFEIDELKIEEKDIVFLKKVYGNSEFLSGTCFYVDDIKEDKKEWVNALSNIELINQQVGRIYNKMISTNQFQIILNNKNVQDNPIISSNAEKIKIVREQGVEAILYDVSNDSPSEETRGYYVYFKNKLLTLIPIRQNNLGFNHAEYNQYRVEIFIKSWEELNLLDLKVLNQKNGIGKIKSSNQIIKQIVNELKNFVNHRKNQIHNLYKNDKIDNTIISKKDNSWNEICSKKHIELGTNLDTKDIEKILNGKSDSDYEKETRLLVKVDTKDDLPFVLKQKGLCPYSIDNGKFTMVKNSDLFIDIPEIDESKTSKINLQNKNKGIMFLTKEDITSEQDVVNFATNIKILEEYLKVDRLNHGKSGRQRVNNKTTVKIGDTSLNVEGTQIEIDMCLDDDNTIYLFEVKNRDIKTYNIRQSLTPHEYIQQKFNKPVKSFLIIYDDKTSMLRILPIKIDNIKGKHSFLKKEQMNYQLIWD